MRVLVLGAAGMLGHKFLQMGDERTECWAVVRGPFERYHRYALFHRHRMVRADAGDFDSLVRAIATVRPDAVVNCIGVVKQVPEAADPAVVISINALLPHRLAGLCRAAGARLIHISTDCVFSGRAGLYGEEDVPDAEDLYGRSKLLGEVMTPDTLTLRTSMIGQELGRGHGLVSWFLAQAGQQVQGYRRAVFSGLTTIALSRVILDVLLRHPHLSGLYHVSADPVDKQALLTMLNELFNVGAEILGVEDPAIDRSLRSDRFRAATGFSPPPWPDMLAQMAADPTPYDRWRHDDAA